MTLEALKETIFLRRSGFTKSRRRAPIGIVLSYDYYKLLRSRDGNNLVLKEERIYDIGRPLPGDSFIGLDVAITKAEDTVIVY